MTGKRERSWQDIVPIDAIPAFKWFYQRLWIELVEIMPLFKNELDLQVAGASSNSSWIHLYGSPPDLLMRILSLATGTEQAATRDDAEARTRKCIDLIKRLQGKTMLVDPESIQGKQVVALTMANYAFLKLSLFALLNEVGCVVKFAKSVSQLVDEAKTGDEAAVIKLVSVDHSFLSEPPVLNYLRAATLVGNVSLLRRIALELRRPPIHTDLCRYDDELFILLSWYLGFEKVGVEQFGFFLSEAGVTRFRSTSSLQRKLSRLGISAKAK